MTRGTLLLAGLALLGGAAQAQITATAPQSVAKALQNAGYQAELTSDTGGDPMIRTATMGTRYRVYLYGCTDHRNCKTIQFHTGFSEPDASLERINVWNRDFRWGQAYLDKDGDPNLKMDVDLEQGGITEKLFIDNVEYWEASLAEFQKHLNAK